MSPISFVSEAKQDQRLGQHPLALRTCGSHHLAARKKLSKRTWIYFELLKVNGKLNGSINHVLLDLISLLRS